MIRNKLAYEEKNLKLRLFMISYNSWLLDYEKKWCKVQVRYRYFQNQKWNPISEILQKPEQEPLRA